VAFSFKSVIQWSLSCVSCVRIFMLMAFIVQRIANHMTHNAVLGKIVYWITWLSITHEHRTKSGQETQRISMFFFFVLPYPYVTTDSTLIGSRVHYQKPKISSYLHHSGFMLSKSDISASAEKYHSPSHFNTTLWEKNHVTILINTFTCLDILHINLFTAATRIYHSVRNE